MKRKKPFAVLLAVLLMIGIVPLSAFADELPDPTVTVNLPSTFTVGQPVKFSVSTTGGNKVGTKVIGTADFSNPSAVEKVEYLESKDGNWYELTEDSFGPPEGFPLGDFTSEFRVTFKEAGSFSLTVKIKNANTNEVIVSAESTTVNAELPKPTLTITDCGHFTEATWGGDAGVFSMGWKYSNTDPADISSIRVGAKDAKGRTVVEYTADADQVAWQIKNGYIPLTGSSAPFYKEYNGTPLAEGRDSDWTAAKGEGFDLWQPTLFYVEAVIDGKTYYAEKAYDYNYPHIHETVTSVAAKPATETEEGNIAYWHCADCGKYFRDRALKQELTKEETILEKLPHTTHTGGVATCKSKAVCTVCGQTYGELNPANHEGGTETKNAKDASCTAEGYSGDKVCKGCGVTLEKGKAIEKLAHSFKDGKCSVCGTTDPNNEPKPTAEPTAKPTAEPTTTPTAAPTATPVPSPATGDTTSAALWLTLLLVSAGSLTGAAIVSRKRKHSK